MVNNSQNSHRFGTSWLTLLRDFKIITNQDTQIFLLSDFRSYNMDISSVIYQYAWLCICWYWKAFAIFQTK